MSGETQNTSFSSSLLLLVASGPGLSCGLNGSVQDLAFGKNRKNRMFGCLDSRASGHPNICNGILHSTILAH